LARTPKRGVTLDAEGHEFITRHGLVYARIRGEREDWEYTAPRSGRINGTR